MLWPTTPRESGSECGDSNAAPVFDRPVCHEPEQALAGHSDCAAAPAVDAVEVSTVYVVAKSTPLDLQDFHRVAEPDVVDGYFAAVRVRLAAKDVYGPFDLLLRYFGVEADDAVSVSILIVSCLSGNCPFVVMSRDMMPYMFLNINGVW